MNTFGQLYRLTSFGESHGPAMGGIIDGMPAGVAVDIEAIRHQLARRRPGQSSIVTQRREADEVKLLSGIYEGVTIGTPIGFIIENTDSHSTDYDNLRHCFRPSHADYTYQSKYGVRDHRGGGRSSARETVSRIVGGALAMQALAKKSIRISAYTSQIGAIAMPDDAQAVIYSEGETDSSAVRCPHAPTAGRMEALIKEVQSQGDTVGGVVTCVISGVPVGLGEPVFGKLSARLADAMMSINAAKGFEYGMGFAGVQHKGSEMLDLFESDGDGRIVTATNHSGGIQGGISNGSDIYFRVAFKPVATVLREVATVDDNGRRTAIKVSGRHDPCVVPRAVPIVEAMAAMVMLDALLLDNAPRLF